MFKLLIETNILWHVAYRARPVKCRAVVNQDGPRVHLLPSQYAGKQGGSKDYAVRQERGATG